jgi:hypothetical protein
MGIFSSVTASSVLNGVAVSEVLLWISRFSRLYATNDHPSATVRIIWSSVQICATQGRTYSRDERKEGGGSVLEVHRFSRLKREILEPMFDLYRDRQVDSKGKPREDGRDSGQDERCLSVYQLTILID